MNGIEKNLATIMTRSWWALLLRGIAAIAFGLLTWILPGISLQTLVLLFGAYSLADGILGVSSGIAGRKEHDDWWVMLLGGLAGIGIGLITFLSPGLTATVLLFYIAIWAIATGILQVVAAIRLRKVVRNEWMLVVGGIASLIFGVLLIVQPGAGVLALLSLIAAYAIVFGILLVMLAFKARRFATALA